MLYLFIYKLYINKFSFAGECELTGATNLMAYYGLEHSYSKFNGKKLKESLSSFLPNLPGILDGPGQEDNSTLGSVIAKRPIGGKELLPLSSAQLAGFRLHPGPLPEQYRYVSATPPKRHKTKHKKHKHKDGVPAGQETPLQGNVFTQTIHFIFMTYKNSIFCVILQPFTPFIVTN